jgi:hypothetical protein
VISSPVNGKARDPPAPDNDETDWAPEPIEEADLIPTQIGKLILNKDLEKGKEERLDMLHQYFKKSVEDDSIQVVTTILFNCKHNANLGCEENAE